MDIFPRVADDGDMETRRDVIAKATKLASVALTTRALQAAAPFIRLPSERGTLDDELGRFRAELEDITTRLEVRPPFDTRTAVTAVWTNLDAFHVPHAELSGLKAHAAILGGVNAISIDEPANGAAWFIAAHKYARLAGDRGLISWAHARQAFSHLYWPGGRKSNAVVDASLALIHATSDEQRGMAHMAHARAVAAMGRSGEAVIAIEKATEFADTGGSPYPRPDRWTRAQAHLSAGTALCSFGRVLLPAVEAHHDAALKDAPVDALHYRTHVWLSLGEARARAREYDGAAQVIMGVRSMRPVHRNRVEGIVKVAEARDPGSAPMQHVREWLAATAS